jgi:hypothetical protein
MVVGSAASRTLDTLAQAIPWVAHIEGLRKEGGRHGGVWQNSEVGCLRPPHPADIVAALVAARCECHQPERRQRVRPRGGSPSLAPVAHEQRNLATVASFVCGVAHDPMAIVLALYSIDKLHGLDHVNQEL